MNGWVGLPMVLNAWSLKRKCRHSGEIFQVGCTRVCPVMFIISSAASDGNFIKMKTFPFQWWHSPRKGPAMFSLWLSWPSCWTNDWVYWWFATTKCPCAVTSKQWAGIRCDISRSHVLLLIRKLEETRLGSCFVWPNVLYLWLETSQKSDMAAIMWLNTAGEWNKQSDSACGLLGVWIISKDLLLPVMSNSWHLPIRCPAKIGICDRHCDTPRVGRQDLMYVCTHDSRPEQICKK